MSRRFKRRPLTDAERAARRQADRERIQQAARALLTSEGWQRWIKVRATNGLSRYSLRNQWLTPPPVGESVGVDVDPAHATVIAAEPASRTPA